MDQRIFGVLRGLIPLIFRGGFRQKFLVQKQANTGVILVKDNGRAVGINVIAARCGAVAAAGQVAVTGKRNGQRGRHGANESRVVVKPSFDGRYNGFRCDKTDRFKRDIRFKKSKRLAVEVDLCPQALRFRQIFKTCRDGHPGAGELDGCG